MSGDVTALVEDYLSVVEEKDTEIFRLVEENRRLATQLNNLRAQMHNSSASVEGWRQQCDASVGQMQHEAKRADGAERLLTVLRPFTSHVAALLNCEVDWSASIAAIEEQTLGVTQFLQKTVSEIKRISPRVKHQTKTLEDVLTTSLATAQFTEAENRTLLLTSAQELYNSLRAQEKSDHERVAALESQRATYCHVADFAAEGVQDADGMYNHALGEHVEVSTVHSTLSGESRPATGGLTGFAGSRPGTRSRHNYFTISFEESAAAAFGQVSKLKSERNTAVADATALRVETIRSQQSNLRLVNNITFVNNVADRFAAHALLRIADYQELLLEQREDFFEFRVLHRMFERLTEIDNKNQQLNHVNRQLKERVREQAEIHKKRIRDVEDALESLKNSSEKEIHDQKTLINDLRGKVADSIRRESTLKRNLQAADAEYQAEIDDVRSQTQQLNASMSYAEEHGRSASKALERSQMVVVQLEKKTQQLEEQKDMLQQTLAECELALSATQEENAGLRTARANEEHSVVDEAANHQREVEAYSEKVQRLEQTAAIVKAANESNTAKFTTTVENLKEAQRHELNQVRSKIEELLASQAATQAQWAEQYDDKVGELQEANTAQSELIARIKPDLSNTKEALVRNEEKHSIEIRLLKALIAKAEGEAQRSGQELETLTRTDNTLRENEELRHKVAELEMACEISVKQIAEFREALHMSIDRRQSAHEQQYQQEPPSPVTNNHTQHGLPPRQPAAPQHQQQYYHDPAAAVATTTVHAGGSQSPFQISSVSAVSNATTV